MKSHKKAFTLTEILIVMGIVGFILVIQLIVLMGKVNQYGGVYYTAYNALKRASYNVLADIYCPDCYATGGNSCSGAVCKNHARNFPTTTKEFCQRLAGIEGSASPANKGFFNVAENKCSNEAIDHSAPDFSDENIQFITSNSMKFYISKLYKIKDTLGNETKFFVVYIDLNGNNRPNMYGVKEGSDLLPDIVPFAVTTKGEVVPMGIPTDKLTYMSARVSEPTNTSKTEKKGQTTFKQAILHAWPSNEDGVPYRHYHFPYTLMFDEYGCFDGTCPTASSSNTPKTIGKCTGGTYTCRVSIDKYTTSRY